MAKPHPRHRIFLTQASLTSIYTTLMRSPLRWAGHVFRTKDHRLPKKLLYRKLFQVKRSQGGQKNTSKTLWRSLWNLLVSLLNAWNIWCRTETSGVKLSNVDRKSVKPEETQQLSCAGNLEKALLYQPLPPPYLVLTAQDYSAHRLVSLVICALTDLLLNHKVDQIFLINYDGLRREENARASAYLGLQYIHRLCIFMKKA